MSIRRSATLVLVYIILLGLMGCQSRYAFQKVITETKSTTSIPSLYRVTSTTTILGTPTLISIPVQTNPQAQIDFLTPTQTELPSLLDSELIHPLSRVPDKLVIDIFHMNRPVQAEEVGYDQVQTFLGNKSRWGEPGLRSWWEKMLEANNEELAPFGYHLEGTFQPPSPNSFKVYHNDQVVMDDIEWFLPVSVNRSKTDFLMVVGPTSQETKVISNQKIQPWKDISLWVHATRPQFIGDDILYADMEQTNNQGITNISVYRNNQRIYTNSYLVDGQSIHSPLVDFLTYDEHWALELTDQVIIDGKSVNNLKAYQKSYEFHVLGGKPLYFFEKAGKVNLSYDSEEILFDGTIVPHGNCCSESELNPRQVGNLLIFFMNKNQQWYYVEIEAEPTQ